MIGKAISDRIVGGAFIIGLASLFVGFATVGWVHRCGSPLQTACPCKATAECHCVEKTKELEPVLLK